MVDATTPSHEEVPPHMRSCVWHAKSTVHIDELATPAYGPHDVLVKCMATGICGSDLHVWEDGHLGHVVMRSPLTLGHETSGIVVRVGDKVKSHRVGDHVAIEPGVPCRTCRACKSGNANYCKSDNYAGCWPVPGTLSQYFTVPADLAPKIPTSVSWEAAGCLQPLAIAVQCARRAELKAHQTVAVYGSGPLGLLVMAIAKAYGASKIIAFDISEPRLVFARKHYATHGFLSEPRPAEQDPLEFAKQSAARVLRETEIEEGVDVVIDASGAEPCLQAGIVLLRHGGTFVQAGMGRTFSNIPIQMVTSKELNVKGTLRYNSGCFEDGIDLLARGLIDLGPFVTKTVPLTRSDEAFKIAKAGSEIKVVIMNRA